ncbi:MAG: 6-phosphogluconolactonase [Armatimonadota bacterium]
MHAVDIYPDAEALAEGAASLIAFSAAEAIAARGRFTLVLSGGQTPRATYARLASEPWATRIDWPRVHVFWGDERCVPPDHPESNYRMAREALLDYVPIPAQNIHRILGELPPDDAARDYEQILRRFFGVAPRFDLVLLGMGDDGHTASLFPHSPVLLEQVHWAAAQHIELRGWRITLTPVALNAAAQIAFLVSGAGKAERLNQVLHGPHQPEEQPAQLINPAQGELRWLADAAAAARL